MFPSTTPLIHAPKKDPEDCERALAAALPAKNRDEETPFQGVPIFRRTRGSMDHNGPLDLNRGKTKLEICVF
jgi:hypothetical protein